MARILDADIPPRITADGVTVKRGDIVWRVLGYGTPRRSKVSRTMLKVWANWWLDKEAYADERIALQTARDNAKRRLGKARQQVRYEERLVSQLNAALNPKETS